MRGLRSSIALLVVLAAVGGWAGEAWGQGCGFKIMELRVAQTGADTDEYLELESFAPGQPMDTWTYIVIGGDAVDSGVIEAVVPFTGLTVPADGRMLMTESTFTLLPIGDVDHVTTLDFENEDNKTHMVVAFFTGAVGSDVDSDDDGVIDGTPLWSFIDCSVALIGPNAPGAGGAHVYSAVQVGPKDGLVPSHVYFCPDVGGFKTGIPALGPADTPDVANPDCCPEDLDLNGVVNVFDLVVMLQLWGPCGGGLCPADLDGDGNVNVTDLLLLLTAWGDCLA